METYIAILRGINVSGKKLIKMEELRRHLQDIKLKDVKTYIQSGNIVFNYSPTNQKELATLIAEPGWYRRCWKNIAGYGAHFFF